VPDEGSVHEALAFIAHHPHVYLLTRRPDGFPTGYAMTSQVRDGCVEFSTYRASAKVRYIMRDGTASVLAAGEDGDPTVVIVHGSVTLHEDASWGDGQDGSAARRGSAAPVPPAITQKVNDRHASGKRIVLRLRVEGARVATKAAAPR
jgi:hypothetical protein